MTYKCDKARSNATSVLLFDNVVSGSLMLSRTYAHTRSTCIIHVGYDAVCNLDGTFVISIDSLTGLHRHPLKCVLIYYAQ